MASLKAMQKDKTIQFWDDYHDENDSKEWISTPGEELLAMIFDQICNDGKESVFQQQCGSARLCFSVLEIGCGTSTLARDLKRYIEERNPMIDVIACGTDVSTVCIEINTKRDCCDAPPNSSTDSNDGVDMGSRSRGSLWYEVLNALDGEPSRKNWDLIIDKGCLDTFLFRSRSRGSKNKNYPECLRILLDNVHGWQGKDATAGEAAATDDDDQLVAARTSQTDDNNITDDESSTGEQAQPPGRTKSVYLCITPRRKLKAIKDYTGFSSVERYTLPKSCESTLESKNYSSNGDKDASKSYMYVCTKNDDYEVGVSMPFPIN